MYILKYLENVKTNERKIKNAMLEPLYFLSTGRTVSESDPKVKTTDKVTTTPTPNDNNSAALRREKNAKRKRDKNNAEHDPECGWRPRKLARREIPNRETAVSKREKRCNPDKEHKSDRKVQLFAKYHPFSDMYNAAFTVDGQKYICVAQFTMYRKALYFGDREAAEIILNSNDIKEAIGVRIKGFSMERWQQNEKKSLIEGTFYKFSQIAELKEKLLKTGKIYLGYRSRNLRYGTGLNSNSEDELDRNKWPGDNIHGKILMEVRDLLRVQDEKLKTQRNAMGGSVEESPNSGGSKEEKETNHDDVMDNIETNHQGFPERCLPVCEKLVYKQDSDTLVYDCTRSPFSDMHPAPFTVDGQRFSCAAQYIMYHKAMLFGDEDTAERILKSKDPTKMGLLKPKGFNGKKWAQHVEKIMRAAFFHKFHQNPKLKQLLLRTGDLHLGNKSTEKFYGTGVPFDKTEALDKNHWTGDNIAGKVLKVTRYKLRKQDTSRNSMTHESDAEDNEGASQESKNCEDEMPEGCVPVWEYWIHKWNLETFIFHGEMSPFSNMHPASFTVKGQTYSCTRQYILHQKALMLRHHEAADGILKATDPDEMLGIGMKVKVPDQEKWELYEGRIFVDAAIYKFSQNQKLKELLLNTDDLHLGCMSRNLIYGTGVMFRVKGALNRKMWPGRNVNGESLMKARDELRRQTIR